MVLKIIVTGGLGFIGSNYIGKIIKNKSIIIYNFDFENYASNQDQLKKFKKYKNFVHKKIDISDFKNLKKHFSIIKPDRVINFAAETHVDNSIKFSKRFIESNIIGTFNLLECSRLLLKNQKKLKFKFIQISTDEVYGDLKINEKKKFYENSNFIPSSPYSASKAASDLLVKAWHRTYNLPVIITHSGNNFGPYQNKEKLIPKTIINILKGKNIPIYGKGNQIRNWIYVDDNISALQKIILKGVIGQSYNIGGKKELSNINLVKYICFLISKIKNQKNSQKYLDLIKFVKDREGHDAKYSLNNDKIKKLGWIEETNFEKALLKTINWYIKKLNEL